MMVISIAIAVRYPLTDAKQILDALEAERPTYE
jgi:hypothetical protein